MNDNALKAVAELVGLPAKASETSDNAKLYVELCEYLNHLIDTDFNQLVSILYRIDVSEQKVRLALANAPQNKGAGEIIADLIINREIQKQEWREKYKRGEI
ncbi:MAG: hypothetical protein M9916_09025 [Crocinitomicaceae bacterium]|nr:hypothetical protein [Crocinitomicaceae bacterium]